MDKAGAVRLNCVLAEAKAISQMGYQVQGLMAQANYHLQCKDTRQREQY